MSMHNHLNSWCVTFGFFILQFYWKNAQAYDIILCHVCCFMLNYLQKFIHRYHGLFPLTFSPWQKVYNIFFFFFFNRNQSQEKTCRCVLIWTIRVMHFYDVHIQIIVLNIYRKRPRFPSHRILECTGEENYRSI